MAEERVRSRRKIWRFLERRLEEILAVLFLAVMVVLLTAVIFSRFVLNQGLSAAVELERMAFIWFVYMGAAYAARERRHIRVVAQFMLLPERGRKYLRLVADVVWVFFNLIIIREGIRIITEMIEHPYQSPALSISMAYPYIIVPLSFTLITARVVQNIVKDVKELRDWERSR